MGADEYIGAGYGEFVVWLSGYGLPTTAPPITPILMAMV